MQNRRRIFSQNLRLLILSIIILSGCSQAKETSQSTQELLPSPEVYITSAPSAERVARAFLDKWREEDYVSMYTFLSEESRQRISQDEFFNKYQNVANEVSLSELDYRIASNQINPSTAQIAFDIILASPILGEIDRSTALNLVLEQGQWKVDWSEASILPELEGGNYLGLDRSTFERGTIFDKNGNPIAAQANAIAVGVWPDYINLSESKGLLSLLSTLTNFRADKISNLISNALPGAYIPLGEIPADSDLRKIELLKTWGAVVASDYSRRLYYNNGIAPHVTGYVSAIQEDEIVPFRKKGYRSDERIGRKGLELWGEKILNGKRGGTLYLFSPDGKPIQELVSTQMEPGEDIYTTIDRDLQLEVQKAMSVFNGAIVVMEMDTGRILAMASSPGFNPNAYETDNYNWNTLISFLSNDPDLPQFNRATQGQYPLGSVFKLVTIAAGLESGRFTPETTYECGYTFEELQGFTRYDWTYDHFQEDGFTQPSGLLTLPEGLIRSCNPYFWHIGLDLYNAGLTKAVSDMARSFGLGSKTGIEVIDEETGNIPDPQSSVDAINQAIGQGDVQVTPLQVARFVAAIGNGGTLYRPQLIEKIVDKNGKASFEFKPEIQGTLPIKPENLQVIQKAMEGVIRSEKPRGTAYRIFKDLDLLVAGKTGSATSSAEDPHSWFAGYSFAKKEGKPDIAVAVIGENAGEGSEIAAPIFRRVMELYFFGKPLKAYSWESTFDVTRSPTPVITWTSTPQGGLNP